jgi:TonB-dependent SusC/RagA subfamily outer membrane receptor
MKQLVFITLLLVFTGLFTVAQNQTFSGKITAFEEYPLNKVIIQVKGDDKVVESDADGLFEITCNPNQKIIISANGFQSKKVKPSDYNENQPLNVDLAYKNSKKNYELATENGHIDADYLNHAITRLEVGPDFSKYKDILEAIQGRVAGVSVAPGGFSIRGISTLQDGPVNALLVVDGVTVDYATFISVPTVDVKSIDVLKGASASARYGSRGMGGVIEVQTKAAE